MAAGDVLDVMRSPGETFRRIIASGEGLSLPLAIVLVNGIVSGISSYSQKKLMIEQFRGFGNVGFGALPLEEPNIGVEVLRSVIIAPVAWVVVSAIILAVSKVLGGKAGIKDILTVDGYSQVPIILGGILAMLLLNITMTLSTLVMFIFAVWSFVILVVGVREANQFSTGRALASVLIPVVLLAMFFAVVFAVIFMGIMLAK